MAEAKMGSQNCSAHRGNFRQTLSKENGFGSAILLLLEAVMFTLQFSGVMRSYEYPSALSEPLESAPQSSKSLASNWIILAS